MREQRRVLAVLVMALGWLLLAYLITRGPDMVLELVVGPIIAIAIIARAADLSDELPPFLRISMPPVRVLAAGLAALVLLLAVIVGEVFLIGPDLDQRGAGGVVVPRIIGFSAQPVLAQNVDTEEEREVLYLGGNADLYVLIDPCNNNNVEYVSVGSHKLEVIEEVVCPAIASP